MVAAQNSPNGQEPSYVPDLGTLMVDTGHGNRTGEFRGLAGPYWSLRPVSGGAEWEAVPEQVRTPTRIELLAAEIARINARSLSRRRLGS
ncbi:MULTISPECIES: hypothetical protein [unclassified Streptomyces]|uniref:hypothetical protein n=1 Tax=unclassified Streptomyces TaxID=2593676 RepID=UPI002E1C43AB|nr:hypothetical protein OG217_21330 [Streptomyces sp. NBC_01023]